MAKLYHRPGAKARGQKVFLATPAYDGVGAGYAWALHESARALRDAGIDSELAIFSGGCHVDDARNQLTRDFLLTDCTDLVFLDADISWNAKDLVQLCGYDREIVGGTYPKKQLDPEFPVKFLGGEIWAESDGLIEVAGLPTGFLRITRPVLETLAENANRYKIDAKEPAWEIFHRATYGMDRHSGDYNFCNKARAHGFKCYLAPEFVMEHNEIFVGSVGHHQRVVTHGAIKAGVLELQHGIESVNTFADMADAWANNFAALPDFLATMSELTRRIDGPVLEIGSGLSTLIMAAAGASVTAVEHDPAWRSRVCAALAENNLSARVLSSPLADGWYTVMPKNREYGLVVIDGPPRDVGEREKILTAGIKAQAFLIDDADDPKVLELAAALGEVTLMGKHRPFAIVKPLEAAKAA